MRTIYLQSYLQVAKRYSLQTKLVASSNFTPMAMKCIPNSFMQPITGCEKVKCIALVPKKDKKDTLLFFSETMSIKPQNYLEAVYRMQKRQKHCFWYQNFSNLLQVQITYNARCLFEHENHNTSCKQCIFTTCNVLFTF